MRLDIAPGMEICGAQWQYGLFLRNPWYKGVYRYNYYKIPGRKAIKDESEWVIVENHHPASIDPDRFDRIQAIP